MATAAAICGSDVEAESIVQEAFIEDWDWRPTVGADGGSEPASEDEVLEKAMRRLQKMVVWRARTARRKQNRRAAAEKVRGAPEPGGGDYQCPACRRFHMTLMAVLEKYADEVALVYRHRPLASHQFAYPAARAAECAAQQGAFAEFHS